MIDGRGAGDRAGIVDQDVDRAVISGEPGRKLLDRRPIREIDLNSREAPPERLHAPRNLAAGRLEVRTHSDDVGTGTREHLGHHQADPTPAACDERELSVQVEHRRGIEPGALRHDVHLSRSPDSR